jgi:endonuclease YncB( thermonuclease family)
VAIWLSAPAAAQEKGDFPKRPDDLQGVQVGLKPVSGKVIALDGCMLLLKPDWGKPIRVKLWGVGIPDVKDWPWGPRARGALDHILQTLGPRVVCQPRGKTSQGETMAQCYGHTRKPPKNRVDIGGAMIETGFAIEHRMFFDPPYAASEKRARENRRGIWRAWKP